MIFFRNHTVGIILDFFVKVYKFPILKRFGHVCVQQLKKKLRLILHIVVFSLSKLGLYRVSSLSRTFLHFPGGTWRDLAMSLNLAVDGTAAVADAAQQRGSPPVACKHRNWLQTVCVIPSFAVLFAVSAGRDAARRVRAGIRNVEVWTPQRSLVHFVLP